MESTRPAEFQWSPLGDKQIRVMKLAAGSGEDQVRISLTHHDLEDLPVFHAISYSVGEDSPETVCACEDEKSHGTIKITDSLWQALWQMRREAESIPLWTDQICIDQNNKAEKAQQIRLMSVIYSSAPQVRVWLGLADAETQRVFDLITRTNDHTVLLRQELGERTYDGRDPASAAYPLELSPADSLEWTAFRKLLKRSWFSRLWVFQEVVLARKAIFVCGAYEASWSQLRMVCEAVTQFDMTRPSHESRM